MREIKPNYALLPRRASSEVAQKLHQHDLGMRAGSMGIINRSTSPAYPCKGRRGAIIRVSVFVLTSCFTSCAHLEIIAYVAVDAPRDRGSWFIFWFIAKPDHTTCFRVLLRLRAWCVWCVITIICKRIICSAWSCLTQLHANKKKHLVGDKDC